MQENKIQSFLSSTSSKNLSVPHLSALNKENSVAIFPKITNIKRIGFVFNARPDENMPSSDSLTLEYDEVDTIEGIKSALESGGFDVELLPGNHDIIEVLKIHPVDFVFNIAEGLRGESRESHIPAILEMLGIPYTGSGVLTQALTLSKSRTKEILGYYRIPTPKYQVFRRSQERLASQMKFPLIVKPDAQGSSAGITNDSVVYSSKTLKRQVHRTLHEFGEPVLVEEYLTGREFTVGLIGNNPPFILPIIEVNFNHLPPDFAKIDSYESKWMYDQPGNGVNPLICPANITQTLRKSMERLALKTFKALNCVDLCRIDIRLDRHGNPNILEVNALPGLNPNPEFHSRFPYASNVAGISYNDMILFILYAALRRYNLIT